MNSPLSLPDKLNLDNFKMAFRILPLGTVYSEHVFSIRLLEDEESEEYTDIIFNPREGTYYAPMEESSLLDSVDKRPILGYFPRSGDGAVHIDILLDSSVAEIYINKESCMTLRVYPMKGNAGNGGHRPYIGLRRYPAQRHTLQGPGTEPDCRQIP